MKHDPYKALYVHIPFCVKRCGYCDFETSAVSADDPAIDDYVENLCLQIRHDAKAGELSEIETIYLGGGTPSHIRMARLSLLLYTLSTSLRIGPDVECTMEANPESLTAPMVRDVWALGVNRISLGVQTFDDNLLRLLGRAHDSARAIQAIRLAHERFENVSVDLMVGLPGQSLEQVKTDIYTALAQGITHLSVYPLTIEPHTPFERLVREGKLTIPREDAQADAMEVAEQLLGEAGFSRYEVASYAKPGYECKHNKAYWTGMPYRGVGCSAVTMMQNSQRRLRLQDDKIIDDLDACQSAAEDLMLAMRLADGISETKVAAVAALLPKAPFLFGKLVDQGFVEQSEGRYRPTNRGWLLGNELYGALLDLAP